MYGRRTSYVWQKQWMVTKILELNPNISWTHCSLHREALVSKCLYGDLKNVLITSIKIVAIALI